LEKDPLKRYQKTVDVAIDLDRIPSGREPFTVAGASLNSTNPLIASRKTGRIAFGSRRASVALGLTLLVLAALVTAVVRFVVFRAATSSRPPIKSLAVLPLDNFSGDPAQDYFADGMTEALISSLSRIRELRIVSRTSVMRFKGSARPLQDIARELNVDAVIEGSVQRADGRVKVTTQLINAATDAHIWARDYERQMTDILKLQDEVARAIADEIRIQVTPEERARLASARPVDPAAHEAYLLGRYHFWKLNEEDLRRAIEYFEQAIRLAPDYAAAYAGLSDAWGERGIWGAKTFSEVESPSRAAAKRALELDDGLASAHVSLCHIKLGYDWDWTGAEEEIKRALELDPGDSDAHQSYGNLLQALGRFPEAIAQMEIAEQLDPLSSAIQSTFGRVLYRAGQYPEALKHLNRAIELGPGNYGAYGRLGDLYEEMGRHDEARAAYESAQAIGKNDARGYRARLARMYARAGKPEQALRIIEDLKTGTGSAEFPWLQMAAAYAALGNKAEAFKLLTRAIEQHDSLTVFIKEDPPFKSLHSDRQWTDLLRRMKFPPE
jgi:TolB-like protein/Tfp pilus assembly protein PilF